MRKLANTAEVAFAAFCLVIALATSARPLYAYADPGTGLMAIQIVGATFAGFLFFIRKQVFGLFSRLRKTVNKVEQSANAPSTLPPV
jgi:hypothetical protein